MMRAGYTLVETVVVVAIIAAVIAVAAPSMRRWGANQRLQGSAAKVSAAYSYARSEAVRSGNIQLVLFQADAQGNALGAGAILVVDDGQPGSSDQNCAIDSGEPTKSFTLEDDVSFGVSQASSKVSADAGASTVTAGSTFEDAGGSAATWVLFRPEGRPLAFSSDCTVGAPGSGGGGVYLTNGSRDTAAVLTPLGAVRLHRWDRSAWSI